jgi:hypothetical protein
MRKEQGQPCQGQRKVDGRTEFLQKGAYRVKFDYNPC